MDSKNSDKYIKNQSWKIIEDSEPARILLKNHNGTQYLVLYHLYGSNLNTFNQFEIGKIDFKDSLYTITQFDSFRTEDGIYLGMTDTELMHIKGTNYSTEIVNGCKILEYRIEGNDIDFLKYYNMPLYIAKYYFSDGKLIKFVFGFPYL